jgi:hypothetical protein
MLGGVAGEQPEGCPLCRLTSLRRAHSFADSTPLFLVQPIGRQTAVQSEVSQCRWRSEVKGEPEGRRT